MPGSSEPDLGEVAAVLRRHLPSAGWHAALGRLDAALNQPPTEWTRAAAIQRFEFTFATRT